MKRFLLLLTFLTGQLLALYGQSLKETALENFNNQEWEAAAKAYSKYLKKNEGDSADWYNLASSTLRMEKHEKAIEYFQKALEKNFNAGRCYWGIAKSYAMLEDKVKVMQTLAVGADNGLAAYALLQSDPAFEPYRFLNQFKEVLKKVELNAYPCLTNADYRHFDFWLGEWDVFVNGNKVGENSITMAKGGCAIHESYITARNYAGQSINFFDPIDQLWHQNWVGSSGDTYNYIETKRDKGMLQFESKFKNPINGTLSLSRLTFTLLEDGTVRQLFEASTDDGETWSPAFDGIYKRKE